MCCAYDLVLLSEQLKEKKIPGLPVIKNVCRRVKEILAREENVLCVGAPATVVGDVHGQFPDLLNIFSLGGPPESTRYVFLGDLVDRGNDSLETVLLLFCYKILYAENISLVRGNHESYATSSVYGFLDECVAKTGDCAVWMLVTGVFNYFPLACRVDGFFLVHGGIPNADLSIDAINSLNRFGDIPPEGVMADLVWSDPSEDGAAGLSPRGAGYLFTECDVDRFFARNGVSCIVRSHQLVMEGFKKSFGGKVITVWSAPNYCYRCQNKAAILILFPGGRKKFLVFHSVCQ